ncbi:MAG: hypothetical protein ACLPLR_18600 [Terriglobales bacterium]
MPLLEAESPSTHKQARQRKTLSHLEIHPKMGGGHVVRHVYSSPHETKEYHFNHEGKSQGGEHIHAHLIKHAGLPGLEGYDNRQESETEDEIED